MAASSRRIAQKEALQKSECLVLLTRPLLTASAAQLRAGLATLSGLVSLFARDHAAPPMGCCRISAELPYRASTSAVID